MESQCWWEFLYCFWLEYHQGKKTLNQDEQIHLEKNIPFKCCFLLWRATRRKLPTNEKFINFGYEPHECYCCDSMDIVDHIFLTGDISYNVWKFFAGIYGINYSNILFHDFILRWWDTEYRNKRHWVHLHDVTILCVGTCERTDVVVSMLANSPIWQGWNT